MTVSRRDVLLAAIAGTVGLVSPAWAHHKRGHTKGPTPTPTPTAGGRVPSASLVPAAVLVPTGA